MIALNFENSYLVGDTCIHSAARVPRSSCEMPPPVPATPSAPCAVVAVAEGVAGEGPRVCTYVWVLSKLWGAQAAKAAASLIQRWILAEILRSQ